MICTLRSMKVLESVSLNSNIREGNTGVSKPRAQYIGHIDNGIVRAPQWNFTKTTQSIIGVDSITYEGALNSYEASSPKPACDKTKGCLIAFLSNGDHFQPGGHLS